MLVDQSNISLNDGAYYPSYTSGSPYDCIGVRHDTGIEVISSSGVTAATVYASNLNNRGNAAYVDGHVGYITRLASENAANFDPWK